MNLYSYLNAIGRVWNAGEGQAVAKLISLQDQHVNSPALYLEVPETAVDRQLEPPLDEIVSSHLKVLYYLTLDRELLSIPNI